MSVGKVTGRIFGYGAILLIAWFVILFVLSIIFRFETELPKLAGVILAIIMALLVSLMVNHLKPVALKEALIYSSSWTLFVYLVVLLITVPNGTTELIFGNWVCYFSIILMAISPVLSKLLTIRRGNNN